jgi:hypothetical protein
MHPGAGEIWLAVDSVRRGSGEVGFAVRRSGRSWRGVVQPLRVHAGRCAGGEDGDEDEQPETRHLHTPLSELSHFTTAVKHVRGEMIGGPCFLGAVRSAMTSREPRADKNVGNLYCLSQTSTLRTF